MERGLACWRQFEANTIALSHSYFIRSTLGLDLSNLAGRVRRSLGIFSRLFGNCLLSSRVPNSENGCDRSYTRDHERRDVHGPIEAQQRCWSPARAQIRSRRVSSEV